MVTKIDINCDVGEGVNNEALLMPYISSCSIACGGHAGNKEIMQEVALLAKAHGVKIGAHPSYPDKENFGRKSMQLTNAVFVECIQTQIDKLIQIANACGIVLHHIKPHGALYNDLAKNSEICDIFLTAIQPYKKYKLFAPQHSILIEKAKKAGFKVLIEAFADRNYNDDLSLVSRSHPKALLQTPEEVNNHVLHILKKGKVKTITGNVVPLEAATFCIHGDAPRAEEIVTSLYHTLQKYAISIK